MPVKKTILNSRSFDVYQDRNKYYEVNFLYIIITKFEITEKNILKYLFIFNLI